MRRRVSMSAASSFWPNSSASPELGGSRPVSIFIVVLLPQPLEPRKPKISPWRIENDALSTAVNVPNRRVSSCASMATGASGGNGSRPPDTSLPQLGGSFGWKQSNKRTFERVGVRILLKFVGCAVGQDLPAIHHDHTPEPVRFVHVRRCNHDCKPRTGSHDTVDEFPELPARKRINTGRRLIQEEKI